VLETYRRASAGRPAGPDVTEDLTARELDVLRNVGSGATNAEVAQALHVSEATVKTHLGRVLTKLGLRDRAAAIVFAHTHGLVP
jgi:DNA-binding NarL/FixJ family response regulator